MLLFHARTSVLLIGFLCLLEVTTLSQDQPKTSNDQHYWITGQVTDDQGKPINGAKASLLFHFNQACVSVVTDESGNFEILCPTTSGDNAFSFWELYLWVYASGYNLKCVRPQMEQGQVLPCQVLLNEEDRIDVLVNDANGEPCPEAIVEPCHFDVPNGVYYSEESTGLIGIVPKDVAEVFRVKTNEHGQAEFRGIPIRKFESVYCNTEGMVPQYFSFKRKESLSFTLRPTGKVRGKVLCSDPKVPKPDWAGRKVFITSREKPLKPVAQDRFGRVQCQKTIELDRDGCFELGGVLSGEVSVTLAMGDSELQPLLNRLETLEADGELELDDIEVAKAILVEGTLLTEDTREPLSSVKISVSRQIPSETYFDTSSDDNGKYRFYLHPGTYTVQPFSMSRARQAKDYSYAPSASISIKPDISEYKIPDMLFPRVERETGRLVDADGKALANRRVALLPPNTNHPIKYGTSDAQGNLEIRYDKRQGIIEQNFRWVLYPKNKKSVDGDIRQFPTLQVEEESPLVLMLPSDE